MAWSSCIMLQKVWTSGISDHLKVKFGRGHALWFRNLRTWTIKKEFEKRLDGCYTRLLMKAKNLSWKKHPTRHRIYGDLHPISTTVAQRRARFAGHCMRASDQVISSILPSREPLNNKRGRRPLTFLDIVARDAELDVHEMKTVMLDRAVWRHVVDGISIEDRPK